MLSKISMRSAAQKAAPPAMTMVKAKPSQAMLGKHYAFIHTILLVEEAFL